MKFHISSRILVLNMHKKYDVDAMDSFWDMEEQSMRWKEKRKTGNKKNI